VCKSGCFVCFRVSFLYSKGGRGDGSAAATHDVSVDVRAVCGVQVMPYAPSAPLAEKGQGGWRCERVYGGVWSRRRSVGGGVESDHFVRLFRNVVRSHLELGDGRDGALQPLCVCAWRERAMAMMKSRGGKLASFKQEEVHRSRRMASSRVYVM